MNKLCIVNTAGRSLYCEVDINKKEFKKMNIQHAIFLNFCCKPSQAIQTSNRKPTAILQLVKQLGTESVTLGEYRS